MRCLVTGAGGFVGRFLVEHLRRAGHDVVGTVLDAQREPVPAQIETLELDIAERDQVERVMRQVRPEGVVHLAGLSDVAASWKRMDRYFRANVLGTENVIRSAPTSCRVVSASSAEVYGKVDPTQLPLREEAPLAPATPYALTKAAAERVALEAGALVVRSFNLVGAGQSTRFALPSFAQQLGAMHRGEREAVLRVGNLDARRDFVHVADGVEGYATLLLHEQPEPVVNLASGTATSVRSALDTLIRASGLEVAIEQDPERMRPSDVPAMCGDPGRLENLGWCRRRSLDDAIGDLWRSVRDG